MNLINVAGNAFGIFVLKAGVRGVAYPSLISRVFAAAVMLYLLFSKDTPLRLRLENIFAWDGKMIARLFRIAIPSSIENGLFQLAKIALSSIIALFGTAQIAAYGVAQSFWGVTALFAIAMGPAFITVIGQYMGAQDIEGAEYYSHKLLRITYLGGAVWSFCFLLLVPPLLMLFNLSEEAHRLALILVVVHNVMNALLTPMAFSLSNGLQATGDVRFTMAASILATVVVRVFFAVVFGIWLNFGVIGVVIAMVIDWAVKAALVKLRFNGGKWKNISVI
jgi:Na+-driven multidrug efflux pump